MNYTIKNKYYTLTVSDLGAEMVSLKNNLGKELLWQSYSDELWSDHAPLLFPVCGQLKDKGYVYKGIRYDMSGHGFVKYSTFIPASIENEKILFALYSNEETKKQYPFDFILYATYELREKEIIFSFTVKNQSQEELPYMFGWHPGFVLPTSECRDIESYKIYFGDEYKKVTWTPLQHGCFARPYGEDYSIKLFADDDDFSLLMSWSDNLPYLCVWKEPENAAKFICLEPWSDTPNNGEDEENFESRKMQRLLPGKSETYSYKLNFNW